MLMPIGMPDVLCPWCVQQGYLEIWPFGGVPVLNCRLCHNFALGHLDGGDAVFPDPHIQADRSGIGQQSQT
jgi:hypothetical protein